MNAYVQRIIINLPLPYEQNINIYIDIINLNNTDYIQFDLFIFNSKENQLIFINIDRHDVVVSTRRHRHRNQMF